LKNLIIVLVLPLLCFIIYPSIGMAIGIGEQHLIVGSITPRGDLRILLDKKPSDLTDDDISNLLKQRRDYRDGVDNWSWFCGISFGVSLSCVAMMPATRKSYHNEFYNWRGPLIDTAVISFAIGIISIYKLNNAVKWRNELEDKIELLKIRQGK